MSYFSEIDLSIPSDLEILVAKEYAMRHGLTSKHLIEGLFKQKVTFPSTYNLVAAINSMACSSSYAKGVFLNQLLTSLNIAAYRMNKSVNYAILPLKKCD